MQHPANDYACNTLHVKYAKTAPRNTDDSDSQRWYHNKSTTHPNHDAAPYSRYLCVGTLDRYWVQAATLALNIAMETKGG